MASIDHDLVQIFASHKAELHEKFKVDSLAVFGSVSRGTSTSSSDTEAEMVIKSFTYYANECTPPPSGDWIVCESCTLLDSVMVSGNVYVEDDTLLIIEQGAILCIE